MTITAAGFIAITAEGQSIWGVGQTTSDAIADAMRYGASYATAPCAVPATGRLIEQVKDMGGNITWETVGGVACTIEEALES